MIQSHLGVPLGAETDSTGCGLYSNTSRRSALKLGIKITGNFIKNLVATVKDFFTPTMAYSFA